MVSSVPAKGATQSALLLPFLFCRLVVKQKEKNKKSDKAS